MSTTTGPGGPLLAPVVDRSPVLVVDDRAENVTALRAILDPLEVPVVEAHSGEDALRALLEREFALILLDVNMPHLDGFETAELIKRHPRTAHIPIIFLTAFDDPLAHADEGYRFGAVDYIAKPCDPHVLRAKVRVFLELHHKSVLLERQTRQLQDHVEQLRLSRSALADAQRIAQLGSWEYDPSTGRVRGSRQFHEIFGVGVDDPLPPTASALFGQLRFGDATGEMLLRSTTRTNLEGDLVRADGTVRHVVVHAEPKADTLTIIGTIQDVTDQRKARQALDDMTRELEREREVVQIFQQAVVAPVASHGPEVQLSHLYNAADAAVIGGDWYDVLDLADGRVLLVIGDVAGHGLPAASTMSEIRTALRVVAMHETRPSRLAEEMDRYLLAARAGVYATMLLLVFDQETGTCAVTSAGHLPVIEFGDDGIEARWVPSGPPLGTGAGAREESTFVLKPGRSLVLYTDGLIERRGEAIDDGIDRLCECLESVGADDPALADTVLRELCGGRRLTDDVAILTLHHRDIASTLRLSRPTDLREIASVRSTIRRWLRSFDGEPTAVEDLAMAVSEVVANSCIHAYRVGAKGEFSIEGAITGDDVRLTVRDGGAWRAPRTTGGGRGLQIVKAVVRDMSIERTGTGTTVSMTARFKD